MRSSPPAAPTSSPAERMQVRDLLRDGTRRLREAGLDSADREAEWLLGRLLGMTPTELYLADLAVPAEAARMFMEQVRARRQGEPLQYLLGDAEFFGRTFAVRPGVFIPRPETECVVEAVLAHLRGASGPLRLLDVCTGSGAIAVTLAAELPACHLVALDVSWDPLEVARGNARRHGVLQQIQWVQGRGIDALCPGERFHGLIANPPYIPSAQVGQLPFDVRHEPVLGLDGGPDGMRDLRSLFAGAPQVLRPGGFLALECGEAQAAPLLAAAASAAWVAGARPLHDLSGRPRGVLMTRSWTG